jgi:hypothetical protein
MRRRRRGNGAFTLQRAASRISGHVGMSHKLLGAKDFSARGPLGLRRSPEKFVSSLRAKLTGSEAAAHNGGSPWSQIPKSCRLFA